MKWTNEEAGPTCFCGQPTVVSVNEHGEVNLVCIFHEKDTGAFFPLPKDGRPTNWPNLTDEEVDQVMYDGQIEFENKESLKNEKNKYGLS